MGLEDEIREIRDRENAQEKQQAEEAAERKAWWRLQQEREYRRITEDLAELDAIHTRQRVPVVTLYGAKARRPLYEGWEITPHTPRHHIDYRENISGGFQGAGWVAERLGLFLGHDGNICWFRQMRAKRVFIRPLEMPVDVTAEELGHDALLRVARRLLP